MNKKLLILIYLYEYSFLGLINILWKLEQEELTNIFKDFKDWLNEKNQQEAKEYFNKLNLEQFVQEINKLRVDIKLQLAQY